MNTVVFKPLFHRNRECIGLYFDKNQVLTDLLRRIDGIFGLRQNLLLKIEEKENLNKVLLGYDLIGVEIGGTYHTFYCNNATQELIDRFNLSLNENGLFNEISDWTHVKEYLNDEKNGFELVPWYVAKTKIVTE